MTFFKNKNIYEFKISQNFLHQNDLLTLTLKLRTNTNYQVLLEVQNNGYPTLLIKNIIKDSKKNFYANYQIND